MVEELHHQHGLDEAEHEERHAHRKEHAWGDHGEKRNVWCLKKKKKKTLDIDELTCCVLTLSFFSFSDLETY